MLRHLVCPVKGWTFCFVFWNTLWMRKCSVSSSSWQCCSHIPWHNCEPLFWGAAVITPWPWGSALPDSDHFLSWIWPIPSWMKHHWISVISLVFGLSVPYLLLFPWLDYEVVGYSHTVHTITGARETWGSVEALRSQWPSLQSQKPSKFDIGYSFVYATLHFSRHTYSNLSNV